jgi:hypothetical protein
VYTPKARSAYLARFEQSGLTQREFCRRAEIHLSTFSQWRRMVRTSLVEAKPAFAEVRLVGPKADLGSVVTLRLAKEATLEVSAGMETTWHGLGLMLRALQS